MNTFGSRLKDIRTALKYSQDTLAIELSMSKQAISNIERDRSIMSIVNLQKMFELYNVNLNYLICGKGEMFNAPEYEQVEDELALKIKRILKDEGLLK